jgi:hypothetical protein
MYFIFLFLIVFRAIIKRATFSALTLIMYLGSVKFLPLGIINSLFNTIPIMTFFLDIFYYKKVQFFTKLE